MQQVRKHVPWRQRVQSTIGTNGGERRRPGVTHPWPHSPHTACTATHQHGTSLRDISTEPTSHQLTLTTKGPPLAASLEKYPTNLGDILADIITYGALVGYDGPNSHPSPTT